MLTMTDIQAAQMSREELDLVALVSAYRGNLMRVKEGMGDRLPRDAEDVKQAIDLVDEATLLLTVYINRLLGPLSDL